MRKKNSRKRSVFLLSGAISFLVFLVLLAVSGHISGSLEEQNMAKRWSESGGVAQVSCFFSAGKRMSEDDLREFEHSLDAYLKESSIEVSAEHPSARLWVDAYSAGGTVTLTNGRKNVTADAVGIGGDFFLFHPQKLLSGAYFSGNDLNSDYCVIDEDAAWQLFGSNNVAGMMVEIAGTPHMVTGVIERPSGRMAEAAGLDGTVVYVSLHTLEKYGSSSGINHYEVVMPDPVSHFAYEYVKEQLGRDERETEVLENTTRFGLPARLRLIKAFGTRSMNGKAILYPYWENLARGYEDILGVITLFMILFLLYPTVLVLIFFRLWWKNKGWTFKTVYLKIKDKTERWMEKRYARKKRRKSL